MTIAVLLGGDYEDDAWYLRQVDAAQAVVAADAGHAFLRRHDRWPALLVGDFDSLDAGLLAEARAAGIEILEHPVRKDETDAELAVAAAEARFAGELVLLGALGGALDHELGHLAVLRGLAARGRAARVAAPGLTAAVVRAPARLRIDAATGARASVLALSDGAVLTLRGFEYELTAASLPPTVCRGLRNVVVAPGARLELAGGEALVMVFDGDARIASLP